MRVDARGMLCPWPAIRLARAIREGGGDGVIEVLADDPKAAGELAEIAAAAGWAFAVENGYFCVCRRTP